MLQYDQDFYFRSYYYIVERLDIQRCRDPRLQSFIMKSGREHPPVIHPDEEIKYYTGKTAKEQLAFLILCMVLGGENDLAVANIITHSIKQAQKRKFQGKWNVFEKMIKYFNLDRNDPNWKEINDQSFETIFSLPEFFDFLLTCFSEDDLFGNYYRIAISLLPAFRIRKVQTSLVPKNQKVKKPQRHRGYRDKGFCADLQNGDRRGETSARREANRVNDYIEKIEIDVLGHCNVFGTPYPKKEKHSEEGGD